ncbi:hypothetical protein KKC08_01910 [Patescibacteria group bacterium]|nr:hypothetical protein [Patescibacteria group bacterium]MCG2702347.1 hypothetical protein [Candidatus Parcubacteria bacterium]MBU4264963.1 hypothetical protein [Patescibacteria group bacterium]MBU4389800.1 hypothetical protein [Patescibacteria group bacterium]MBU4396898.1 hypothetical protein [Patescibacteria group bacterium]
MLTLILLSFLLLISKPILAIPPTTESATISLPTPTEIPPTPAPTLSPYQQAKKDYLNQQQEYSQAYLKYTEKKETHTKYGTITTEKEKMEWTKKAIISRNTLLQKYILALKTKLSEYSDNNPTNTKKNQIELEKWISWLKEQNIIVDSLSNLDDLSQNGQNFQSKYNSIQKEIYTSIVQNQCNNYEQILNELKNLATKIQNSDQIETEGQNWTSDVFIKMDIARDNLNTALKKTEQKQYGNKFNNFYPQSKKELSKTNQYSLEIFSNLKSIITKFYQTQ